MPNFKVLENNGTLTTASDGITINKANQQNKSGIIKGRLNNLAITNSSNTLNVDTGHLIINGINLILEDSASFTIASTSSITTRYLICEIVATSEGITAELKIMNQYSEGSLNFTTDIITGTYRALVALVYVDSNGIRNIVKNLTFIDYDPLLINLSDYVDSATITRVLNILQRGLPGTDTYNFDIDINNNIFFNRNEIILSIQGLEYTLVKSAVEVELYIWKYILYNRNTQTGITLIYDGEEGTTTISVSVNVMEEKHLYEHNIVLANNSSDITQSSVLVTFKILTNSGTPMDESDVAILLHERGNSGIETCVTASGRYDDDSFSFNYDDSNFATGYCDSVVIGVYGNNDEELMLVVMTLDEDEQTKVYSTTTSSSYWHDTVVPLI